MVRRILLLITLAALMIIAHLVGSSQARAVYQDQLSQGGNQSPGAPGTPSDGGSVTNSTSVTWSWTAATDSDGSISDYQIDIGTSAGGSDVASATSTSAATSYTKTGLSNGSVDRNPIGVT